MHDELKGRLRGCFYTVFTPFAEDESVDFDALEGYLSFLYSGGARRFYVMAYNSRYSQLSTEEIFELNEFCIRKVKQLNRENIVIVGDPIHCSTAQSTCFAQHARDCGGDLISLIVREKYFCDEQILEHFAAVARAASFPILVHEMPFLSGYSGSAMHWPSSLLSALRSNPHIVAIKEDAKDFDTTRAALELEPDIRVIIAGRKSEFMKFRSMGASAYLNGISIIDPSIGERFWVAYEQGDSHTIDFILNSLEAPFFDGPVKKYGWHRCNKALLQAANLMHRRDRLPMPHLSDAEFGEIQACYRAIVSAWGARLGAKEEGAGVR